MIAAPKVTTATSAAMTPADASAMLTEVYGEYPRVYDKSGVDYTTTALSASFQQGGIYSNVVNTESAKKGLLTDESGGTSDPSSPSPVPEPNALLLVGIGLASLGIALRLRR
ncbi:MAG: PEP-CTERM sorting domain-containing protein [Candidatus Zixiibacteriota bacterium]|nr:MAG: PEP-CTERM sorting domain-containing protein [candidate division Zixibacteria bacterium]